MNTNQNKFGKYERIGFKINNNLIFRRRGKKILNEIELRSAALCGQT
jgi:hypothetical protein